MLFNSLDFAIFFPIVYVIYWLLGRNHSRHQNLILLFASYFFYGWWDLRFVPLLLISTIADYLIANQIRQTTEQRQRKNWLILSIVLNIGLLAFFKYANFFIESFTSSFTLLGFDLASSSLNIILPVGISFYTFQTLSYTIDVYRKELDFNPNFLSYAVYVSFFPQLVAGPIERAKDLLPQFEQKRTSNYQQGASGCRQILWGLFKKIVIADNCAQQVDFIFSNYQDLNGSTLLVGAFFFAFQIYGDFSGYSDMAIGFAKLLGIQLKQNFENPYFADSLKSFWRRWHISLTSWFRDYLYIPLGGNLAGNTKWIFNILIVFGISGAWHGAQWTFIIWGLLHGSLFITESFLKKNLPRLIQEKWTIQLTSFLGALITFLVTTLLWVLFRSESLPESINYYQQIFSASLFDPANLRDSDTLTLFFIFVLVALEWKFRSFSHPLFELSKTSNINRWIIYTALLLTIFLFGAYANEQAFIYFKF